ncbi:alpha,alpha-trehalase TreA [Erwinia sp. HR93]|uniref:alpha,alpha-trehalase TreA n=1 Tax=Erwinia sp. HR93 TaxID=3094840 RepID=UPI002ADEF043|nr:alpha,alpha-trehalase TreA [Erwinia sp. HR93]MEA1065199.1 alpha,alpha-trehalase TreA [Erwinia sp. HR93]
MMPATFWLPRSLLLSASLLFIAAPLPLIAADGEKPQQETALPSPPDVLLGPLFDAVQRARLFNDQKIFADAIPKHAPSAIVADWQMQRHLSGFNLRHFIEFNFNLPPAPKKYTPPQGESLRTHINNLWPVLTRETKTTPRGGSLLALPHPYVVPGGRFREVYYWDSYFTMLGLAQSGRWESVRHMVDNFAWEIDRWGHIPNGNRSYYLSRSQPPFFALMVDLLASHEGEKTLVRYLPQLQKEHAWWMDGAEEVDNGHARLRVVKLRDGSLLNRYWDDRALPRPESWAEDIQTAHDNPKRSAADIYRDLRAGAASGWDFSSRWLDNPAKLSTIHTTKIVPVDLNALLWQLEKTLARAAEAAGDNALSERYKTLAQARQRAIETHLWNDDAGWYADYDLRREKTRSQLTAATLFPLYVGLAPDARADKTARAVRNGLLKPGGLVTTTENTGQQWDAPNGWAPLQWVAIEGLNRYHHEALAQDIAWRFLNTVQNTFNRERKLVEKYNVTAPGLGGGGEYPLQDGFGWSNGVTLKILELLCQETRPCDNVPKQPPAGIVAQENTL